MNLTRRRFLKGAAGAGMLGSFGGLEALLPMSPLNAAETTVTPDIVQFTAEIEPVVRLIEDTPQAKCIELMAERLRKGLTYKQFLAALFLAGIRNVNPQPPGFKFHCVFVIHAANYLSRMAPPEERLLPLFYALDTFKSSQRQDVAQGDFVLHTPKGPLPSGETAWQELRAGMADWDEPRADRAITALIREKGHEEVFDGLWEYGARDYRNIGHKAIFVANAWRVLKTIGWQHAEPTLRSLILGLLDYKTEVVNKYAFDDQAYHLNVELVRQSVAKLPGDWAASEGNRAATEELLVPLRAGRTDEACKLAAKGLVEGRCKAGAVWDAAHLAGGELMMRQRGIFGLHTVTSVNALRFAFRTSRRPQTRLLMVLQAIGWMGQFRNLMEMRRDTEVRITELTPADIPESPEEAAESILESITTDQAGAAQKAFRYAQRFSEPDVLFQGARRLVFAKGVEEHEYKWPAAVFEDYHLVSPEWRPHMLAASVYYLRGHGHADSPVIERAVKALKGD